MLMRTVLVVALFGCASEIAPELEELVELDTLPAADWKIDLRDETRAYLIQGLLVDRMAEIDLICPDGTEMDLKNWVRMTNLSLEEPLDIAEGGIVLSAREDVAQQGTPCPSTCHQCPDGAWVCRNVCDGTRIDARNRGNTPSPSESGSGQPPSEPRNAAPSDGPRPDEDPTPRTPQEPSQPPPHL